MKIARATAAAFAALLALPAIADGGADLYKVKCAGCHGVTGAGDSAVGRKLGVKPLNSAEVQKKTDKDLVQIVTKGAGKMPAFGGKLTDPQIAEVVAFIRSLKK